MSPGKSASGMSGTGRGIRRTGHEGPEWVTVITAMGAGSDSGVLIARSSSQSVPLREGSCALASALSAAANAKSRHAARNGIDAVPVRCGQIAAVSLPDAGHDEYEKCDRAEEENGRSGEDDVKGDHFHCSLFSFAGMVAAWYSTGPNRREVWWWR